MIVNTVKTITNNYEQRTMNYQKQTQSKPILSATPFGGFISLLPAVGGQADLATKGIFNERRTVTPIIMQGVI
jgi:hypothetical protein